MWQRKNEPLSIKDFYLCFKFCILSFIKNLNIKIIILLSDRYFYFGSFILDNIQFFLFFIYSNSKFMKCYEGYNECKYESNLKPYP